MKQLCLALALVCAAPAYASDCFADYKAKQDNPLKLHYGVIKLQGPCDISAAKTEITPRLKAGGWTLLNIMSVFGPDGLATRKDSAGSFYLRF